MSREPQNYAWIGVGDINGFFGLMFDNIATLSFLAGTLIIGFNFPADIVHTRMFPGTTFGVLVGDLAYTWLAFRLAKKTGRTDVTAMPLGLDTPSTIGLALTVLGPSFLAFKQAGVTPEEAAIMSWHIGMATMVLMGIVKIIMSFCGNWIRKIVPRAGLLGSIAGVGLTLIGFMPLVDVFGLPVIGVLSLGLILYTVVAGIQLPKGLPGILLAIVLGTACFHLSDFLGLRGFAPHISSWQLPQLHVGLPLPTLGFLDGMLPALKFLPISIPFAILTIVGGINVTESAHAAGDAYDTRDILLTEAWATLVAGLCGGVAQSCPYIGHPAYKRMGARAGYTLLTAGFIGLGGIMGYVSFIVELVPRAVLAPILVFIGLEITAQAFVHTPRRHSHAVVLAMLPTVARLLSIQYESPSIVPVPHLQELITKATHAGLPEVLVVIALGNGFIMTGMLWGAFLAEMIDRRLRVSAVHAFILGVLSFFGIIHSAMPDASLYFPWRLEGMARELCYQFTLAYLLLAGLIFAFSFSVSGKEMPPSHCSDETECSRHCPAPSHDSLQKSP